MSQKPSPLKEEKLKKLKELLNQGVNPYPHSWKRKRSSSIQLKRITDCLEGEISLQSDRASVGQEVRQKDCLESFPQSASQPLPEKSPAKTGAFLAKNSVLSGAKPQDIFYFAGRLMRKRIMGKTAFFNLQDEEGEFQCYIRKDDFPSKWMAFEEAKLLMQKEGLATKELFDFWGQKGQRPKNFPPFPDTAYQGFGWQNFQEFFRASPSDLKEAKNPPPGPWELWKLCDIGDIIGVSGRLFKTKKGEPSLRVEDLTFLCKSLEPLPEKHHGLEDPELKRRYRHLDLIMDQKARERFKIRSQIIQEIRSFMTGRGFMEAETPVLQPLYGGAAAQPFETYFRRLNKKMYLKISPEIYLKKLIVGGFEKVFEIGKNFRNEGIDRSHNPEFLMMEYYEAYTDYNDQMRQFTELMGHVTKKIKGNLKFNYQGRELDLSLPWTKISLQDFEDIVSLMAVWPLKGSEFKLKYKGEALSPSLFWREVHKEIKTQKEKEEIKFPDFWIKIQTEKLLNDLSKSRAGNFEKKRQKASSLSEWKALKEDLISQWDKEKTPNPLKDRWGRFNKLLSYTKSLDPTADLKKFEKLVNRPPCSQVKSLRDELLLMACERTVEKYFWDPVFIMDFPLAGSPLTKKSRDPRQKRVVERFEPYIAGMELGNAYTELNDPIDQRQRLMDQKREEDREGSILKPEDQKRGGDRERSVLKPEDQKREGDREREFSFSPGLKPENLYALKKDQKKLKNKAPQEEAGFDYKGPAEKNIPQEETDFESSPQIDENFIQALEVGMPPTGGVGLGIERLVMILTDQSHIRDTLLFPMLKDKT